MVHHHEVVRSYSSAGRSSALNTKTISWWGWPANVKMFSITLTRATSVSSASSFAQFQDDASARLADYERQWSLVRFAWRVDVTGESKNARRRGGRVSVGVSVISV